MSKSSKINWWDLAENEAAPPQVRPCKLCGQNIFFHRTENGKMIPLDEAPIFPYTKPVIVGNQVYQSYIFEPHFASCPEYKKRKKLGFKKMAGGSK